ncbi:MAG: hypothetical protein ABGZ35_32215 [Planctomycetaceae bacterium]
MSRIPITLTCLAVLFATNSVHADEPPTQAKMQQNVAKYLLESSQESVAETIDRIWENNGGSNVSRVVGEGDAVADQISRKLTVDAPNNVMSMSWELDGFSNPTAEELSNVADVVINANEGILGNYAQPLKDAFYIGEPQGDDVFSAPVGLTMPVDELLYRAGYNHEHSLDGIPFPFTQSHCITLAAFCFHKCLFRDAVAIAQHGLRFGANSTLLFIRGASELGLGDKTAALSTIETLRTAVGNLEMQYNVIAGPIKIRFWIALRDQSVPSDQALTQR